jgi:hypothetical protein
MPLDNFVTFEDFYKRLLEGSIEFPIFPSETNTLRDYCFFNTKTLLSVILPDSITSIGKHCFGNCSNLISIKLPNGIQILKTSTFATCSNLASITIPDSVTALEPSLFANCILLQEVNMTNNLSVINYNVFRGCVGLTKIWIPISCVTIDTPAYNASPFFQCSPSLVIYCECSQANKPVGWGTYWNYYGDGAALSIVWSTTREQYDAL